MLDFVLQEKLRSHQHAPAERLIEIFARSNAAVDLSDCGVGKTYTACAVVHALKTPTLVVCPKIATTQWKNAAAHFGDSISVVGYELLRGGRTPFGTWQNMPDGEDRSYYVCQTCQCKVDPKNPMPCYAHSAGIHCLVRKVKPWDYGNFNFHPAVRTIIFDEVQRCGALKSLNAEMLIGAKRQGRRVLGLSATLASSPLQMRAIGYVLDFYRQPSHWASWARKFSVYYDTAFHGYHWFCAETKQSAVMASIREEIIPARGVRVTTKEIPGFPEVDIQAELYDLDTADQIQKIQSEMAGSLQRLADRAENDVETPLTIQLRAHQRVEIFKIPLIVELVEDYMDQGISVGVFVSFRETMDELRKRLKCDCFIDGSPEGVKHRQRSIDAFQSNHSRLILVNSAAGGACLSLHDLHGGHPRGGLVLPGYSAEKLKQVLGRFPRDGGKSKSFYRILLAAGTGDEKIHKTLRCKLNALDSLNDADLCPSNLTIQER